MSCILWLSLAILYVYCEEGLVIEGTKFDGLMQELIWCGESNQVVIIRTETNSVYRSDNRGVNFKKITKHMQKVADEIVDNSGEIGDVTNMIKSEADDNTVVFVGSKGVIWVSNNCGATMTAVNKDFQIKIIKLHPIEVNWFLAAEAQKCGPKDKKCIPGHLTLYMTENMGQSWKLIARNIVHFEWPFNIKQMWYSIPTTRIYALMAQPKKNPAFISTDDYFGNTTIIAQDCLDFKMRMNFLFVTQQTKAKTLALLVSNLQDNFNVFYKAMLPIESLEPKQFHILDTSEGAVFLLITATMGAPYGDLYVSDSTGLRYSLILRHCLTQVSHGGDFMKIQGLEGIYLANVLEEKAVKEFEKQMEQDELEEEEWEEEERQQGADRTGTRKKLQKRLLQDNVRTYITFNKGGAWHYIQGPKVDSKNKVINCPGNEDCSLNLKLYKGTSASFLSHPNARGIIIALGNAGRNLAVSDAKSNIYLSRDGGVTWNEVSKGPHFYNIADHGGLIVITPTPHEGQEILELDYTWNEGLSWKNIKLSNENSTIEDIFTEPDSSTQHFIVRADSEVDSVKATTIYNLNFESLHEKACANLQYAGAADSDYEVWTPYNGRPGQPCLMGRRVSYVRRKREAECYNGLKYESIQNIDHCKCTEEDYECDFGFGRNSKEPNSPCIALTNISYAPPKVCPSGTTYAVTTGYRKISGDSCQDGIKHDPIYIPCPASSLMGSALIIMILLGVIVILLCAVAYSYQNFDEVKKKLNATFAQKKTISNETEFKDVKYGEVAAKVEEQEEELVIQASAKPNEEMTEMKPK